MDIEDINNQAINNPLSKEELKKQFVEKTKELGLKHTFCAQGGCCDNDNNNSGGYVNDTPACYDSTNLGPYYGNVDANTNNNTTKNTHK